MIDRLVSWLFACNQQHTYLRIELPSYGIEEPPVRVDLLRVFLLQHEDDLNWYLFIDINGCGKPMELKCAYQITRVARMRLDKLRCRVNRELGSILKARDQLGGSDRRGARLEDVRDCRLIVHGLLQYPILIYPDRCKHVQDGGIHRSEPIGYQRDDNTLPSRSSFSGSMAPELGAIYLESADRAEPSLRAGQTLWCCRYPGC